MPSMKELLEIRDAIAERYEIVSVKGGFLFIKHRGRAVEVSVDGNHWWIEFWDASDDEYADSVRQVHVGTDAQAIEELTAWFKE
jgi:hypothetical protein